MLHGSVDHVFDSHSRNTSTMRRTGINIERYAITGASPWEAPEGGHNAVRAQRSSRQFYPFDKMLMHFSLGSYRV